MKKFLLVILSVTCIFGATVSLTACSAYNDNGDTNAEPTAIINLADCEIGYELPVYPTCKFNYKVTDDCTIHIDSFTATLTEKHRVDENDTLIGEFYPYVIKLKVTATTDANNADKVIYFRYKYEEGFHSSMKATIASDGSIVWENSIFLHNHFTIYFLSVEFE